MKELTTMNKEIRRISLALMLVMSGASLMIWQGSFRTIAAGVVIGTMVGLIGYQMIQSMSASIEYASNPKSKGQAGYYARFALYTIIFALSAYRGISILALLVGMMCHKVAIILYACLHRKEVD